MIGSIIALTVGVAAIILGFKGFTADGIPFTSTRKITGVPATIIGIVCLLVGAAFTWAGVWELVFVSSRR